MLALAFNLLGWYSCNSFFNVLNKQALNLFPYPWVVAWLQLFAGVALIAPAWLAGLRTAPKVDAHFLGANFLPMGLLHSTGHAAQVFSFGAGSVFMAHAALTSTVCFAFAKVIAKKLMTKRIKEERGLDARNNYALLTCCSCACLVGPSLYLEGAAARAAFDAPGLDRTLVLKLVAQSGALYYLSNEFSFQVLDLLGPVPQAVANAAKRVFVLVAAVLFLGEAPSQRKVVGSAVALGGVLAFGLSRGAAPAKPKAASLQENAVFSDDDNFVSPTAAADATEAALKSSSGGASSAWSEALQAAVARRPRPGRRRRRTSPPRRGTRRRPSPAARTPSRPGRSGTGGALPLGRALPLDALKKLQPTTDTVAVPLGETGVALVAVVAGRAMANATVTVDAPGVASPAASISRPSPRASPRRRPRRAGRPRGGETAGALTVRAGGRAVATARLTLEAPPPASRRVASARQRRVAWLASAAPRRAPAAEPVDDRIIDLGLGRSLALARGKRAGLGVFAAVARRDLFDDRGLRLELAPDCGAWKRTSDVLTRSLDDGAPVFVWRWTSACGESRVSFEARVAPRDARVVAAATVEAPAPWDDLDWKLSPPYPAGWRHGGMGWTTDDGVVTLRASGGPAAKHKRRGVFGRKGAASATRLDFSFAVTPARALTPAAIFAPEMRRFHAKQYINYPFHDATMHRLRRYAQSCEAAGVAVSPYYTHRETSIHAAELALASALFRGTADAPLAAYESRSPDGRPRTDRTLDARLGAGDYVLAWRTPRGARHLALCGGMKGFYMDGISASPAAIGAARRGAERALSKVASKKNAPHRAPFLDLHAANKTAMLSGAVRKQPRLYYRALLFGMTERAGWFDSDTSLARLGALWAVVDAFELRDSELVGFWRRGDARFAATAPGDCGDRVKRTAFVVDGAAVVVLASWASTPCAVADVAALAARAAFQPRVPHLQCGAPAEDVASGTLRVDVDAGGGAVDGHAAEFYEIELPPYEQFKLLAPGSVEVSKRVAQMLPGGPALQQRDVQVRLGEPSPLDFGNICAKLISSEVAAIQKALRSGNKTAKRTTVNLSSYSKYEFNIVRKSVYESEDLLKLENMYGKGFHFCIRGRPSRPEAKPVRLEAHNPRDVQVLVKLVREYNFSNETLTLRTTWRRVVHVCPVDAQNLRLGQSEDQSDEQSDEQDDAPAWKHVGRDVEFVYNNKEYNIDEIFADDGEDKVRAVNVRDGSDALELPAAEVDEILERMIHPESSKASEEPPRAAAPTGSRPPEDAAREEPTPPSAPATTVPMPTRPVTAPTPTELLESTLAPARDASAPAAAALAY
ncbi:hypothetical protein JL722_89 [Aureococcus anophagefferens]|nr:hypothetical protein JL722_89 [Aureococcus anophagefferens]